MDTDAVFLIFMIIFFGVWYTLAVVGVIKHWYDLIRCIKRKQYRKTFIHIYSFCFASLMVFVPLWLSFGLSIHTWLYMLGIAMAISGVIIYYLPNKQEKPKVVVAPKPAKSQAISTKMLQLEQQGTQLWESYSNKDAEVFWQAYEKVLTNIKKLS